MIKFKKLLFTLIVTITFLLTTSYTMAYCIPIPPFAYCAGCSVPCPVNDTVTSTPTWLEKIQELYTKLEKWYQQYQEVVNNYNRFAGGDGFNLSTYLKTNILSDNQYYDLADLLSQCDKELPQEICTEEDSKFSTFSSGQGDSITKTDIIELSNNVRKYFFLPNDKKDMHNVTTMQEYESRQKRAKITSAINGYAVALMARQNLENILKEMEDLEEEMKQAKSEGNNNQEQNNNNNNNQEEDDNEDENVRRMWRINYQAKLLFQKSLIQTNNLMTTWLEMKSLSGIDDIHTAANVGEAPHQDDGYGKSDVNYTQTSEDEKEKWNDCNEACNAINDQLNKMQSNLQKAIDLHNLRKNMNSYTAVQEQAINAINEHKKTYAQLKASIANLEAHLGNIFVDPAAAFDILSKDIFSNTGQNDLIYDNTEFLNEDHYDTTIDTTKKIMDKLKTGATKENGEFPIEEYLGKLHDGSDGVHQNMKACANYDEQNNCTKYQVEKSLEELTSKGTNGSNPNIFYPPSVVEDSQQYSNEDLIQFCVDAEIFSMCLNQHDMNYCNNTDSMDNFLSAITEEKQQQLSTDCANDDKLKDSINALLDAKMTGQSYAKLTKDQKIEIIDFSTTAYPYLDQAIAFYMETDKDLRYQWYLRYGANADQAVKYYESLDDPERFEDVPPLWDIDNPWWESFKSNVNPELGDVLNQSAPAVARMSNCGDKVFTAPSQGAEGLLGSTGHNKKCIAQYVTDIVTSDADLKNIPYDNIKYPTIEDYFISDEGLAHLEYIFMQKYLDAYNNDSLNEPGLEQILKNPDYELIKKQMTVLDLNDNFSIVDVYQFSFDMKKDEDGVIPENESAKPICGCDGERIIEKSEIYNSTADALFRDFILAQDPRDFINTYDFNINSVKMEPDFALHIQTEKERAESFATFEEEKLGVCKVNPVQCAIDQDEP